jgi:hypothetical protein
MLGTYNDIRMIDRQYTAKITFILIFLFLGAIAVLIPLNSFDTTPKPITASPFEVIASDLDSPRGIAFGLDGALYIAEAGRGSGELCLPGPNYEIMEFESYCFGLSGAVTRVIDGHQERIVIGLPSFASADGSEGVGPNDVAIHGDDVFILVGLGANPALRDNSALPAPASNLGTIIRLMDGGEWETIVDIAAYEASENPDGGNIDSNPFGLVAFEDGFVVADAGANDVLGVDASNNVFTLAVVPDGTADAPAFLELAPNAKVPMQSVPTSIVIGPDGNYYVGQLTGFPFPVGAANIFKMTPEEEPLVFADGFTNIVDLDFDDDGYLWVLEIAGNSLLADEPAGSLIRVSPDGTRETVMSEGLIMPAGLAIGPDSSIYVSNCGTCVGVGEVIRVSVIEPDASRANDDLVTLLVSVGLVISVAIASTGGVFLIIRKNRESAI